MLPTRFQRNDSPFEALIREFNRSLAPVQTEGQAHPEGKGILGHYPVDVHEDEKTLFVDAEMPGFTKQDVKVTIDQGILTIQAERKLHDKKDGKHAEKHLNERRYTRVSRSFNLPTEVNSDSVHAKLDHGVLHITLDKTQEVQPKRITIN